MSSSRSFRRRFIGWTLVLFSLSTTWTLPAASAASSDNVVLRWNTALLQAVRTGTLGPPMVSRALAIAHTCMFDAWAAYDRRAVGTQFGGTLRRPIGERTATNKNKTISFAAYRAAVDLYPGSKATFDSLMSSLGLDPNDTSTDVSTPTGIGNVACQAVLAFRHQDGSNQLGDNAGGAAGVPYSDYTGYVPSNEPMDLTGSFDPATVLDPNKWQPLTYINAAGTKVTPKWLAHQWNQVIPFALTSSSQFRSPTGPVQYGSAEYLQQAIDLLNISANLTDEQKMISEYWSDGPASETPPGHWNLLAQLVSRRDRHGVDVDVKMFFALTNAIFDAGICAWDNKVAYDSVRPITAIRYLFQGQTVSAWGGPNQGTKQIDGGTWFPYQKTTFPTPPFAEYASGHSTFSAAGAEILRLFTGSDAFVSSVTMAAGSSLVEPGVTPAAPVTLTWSTFSAAADQAGISRIYGGIHFYDGDVDARADGKTLAAQAYTKALTYFNGTAV